MAGAITGLLVLGTFVIPGTYGAKTELTSEARRADGARVVSSAELDGGSATLAGRIYDEAGRPLGGALVSLAGSGFWPARSVRSAADGRSKVNHSYVNANPHPPVIEILLPEKIRYDWDPELE